ncbi:MAG: Na+/H+ antiporter subunit E, partial [Gammaproteobacteria bacterium]
IMLVAWSKGGWGISAGYPILRKTISLFVVLVGTWLLLSGHWSVLLLSLGLASVLLVVFCVKRLQVLDEESMPIEIIPGLIRYAPWLIKQIILSCLDVAKRILNPKMPISPAIVHIEAGQKSDMGRVSLANSITLTPGTISLDVGHDEIEVHALSAEAAADLAEGEMARRVHKKVEGE